MATPTVDHPWLTSLARSLGLSWWLQYRMLEGWLTQVLSNLVPVIIFNFPGHKY